MYKFELPFPPSVNSYYRSLVKRGSSIAYVTRSAKGKAYRAAIKSLLHGTPTLTGNLFVNVVLHAPCNRRRDIDNYDGKALFDSLTHAGVWQDDSQVKERHSKWGENVSGGKVVVEISVIE